MNDRDRWLQICATTSLRSSSMLGSSDRSFRTDHCDPRWNEVNSTFAKDAWSIYTQKGKQGREIYSKLHPQYLADNDDHYGTNTRKLVAQSPSRSRSQPRFRTLLCFRIVVQRLDCHIDEVGTIRDVVIGIRDAAQAQADAADKAKIIHRDISARNIMAKFHWANGDKEIRKIQGYLIDWDLAVDLADQEGAKEKLIGRMGTWYFIAAGLVPGAGKPTLPQNRLDGVESLFNVLVYVASHFAPHKWGSSEELSTFVYSYFYFGSSKIVFLRDQGRSLVEQLHHAPLRALIWSLAKTLAVRYQVIENMDNVNYLTFGTEDAKIGINEDSRFRIRALEALDNPQWLVSVLNRALGLAGLGPDDRLIKHTLLPLPGLSSDHWP
ncbi:hypothetical protein BDN72DRAFT_962770 [Pluteus cervinus]|uniref:Uncharacterized protein n=1 Tax=Pluteus cervinus TaxID=181527 RepID=A0ACD3AGP2_9AGAR|nr:hypothetical protein BDN72DRAFT_962770 [Pluteus cervinus]